LKDEDVHNLEAIIDETRQAISTNDLFLMIESDKRFHEYLVNHSNHSRLKDLWSQIMWQWEVLIYRRARLDPATVMPTVIPDHTSIVQALKEKNLAQISELHRAINIRVAGNLKNMVDQEPR
jgi:DNA-binding GntR family transcriptional regulator